VAAKPAGDDDDSWVEAAGSLDRQADGGLVGDGERRMRGVSTRAALRISSPVTSPQMPEKPSGARPSESSRSATPISGKEFYIVSLDDRRAGGVLATRTPAAT
jgi:hypothetical protein